jgi:2,3-bisphosphoglycerate-independent phosphoglycerate mutase
VYDAAVEAIGKTDAAVGAVYKACQEAVYLLLITADHGNAEQMLNPDTGAPHTAHTTNPVQFIMIDPEKFKFAVDKRDGEEEEGALRDAAPTSLDLLGLDQPEGKLSSVSTIQITADSFFAEMTGRSLLAKSE